MGDSELESAKRNIRSILITYQKGCTLRDLKKDHRSLLGTPIPSAKFGFSSDVDFLKRLPDVVIMTPYGNGEYHLLGIADEKSQHIQKMVAKQKPPKHKPPPLRHRRMYQYETYTTAPRFQTMSVKKGLSTAVKNDVVDLVRRFPSGLNVSHFESCFEKCYRRKFSFREAGFLTLQDCIETIPELALKNEGNNILIHSMSNLPNRNASSSQSTVKEHLPVGTTQSSLQTRTAAAFSQSKPEEKNYNFPSNTNVPSNFQTHTTTVFSQEKPITKNHNLSSSSTTQSSLQTRTTATFSQSKPEERNYNFPSNTNVPSNFQTHTTFVVSQAKPITTNHNLSSNSNVTNNLQPQATVAVSQTEPGNRIYHFPSNNNVSSNLPLYNLSDTVPLWKANDRISHFLDSSNTTNDIDLLSPAASSFTPPKPVDANSHFQNNNITTNVTQSYTTSLHTAPKIDNPQYFQDNATSGTENGGKVKWKDFDQSSSKIDTLDTFSLVHLKTDNGSNVPETVKKNLKKVMEMHPQGIWATDFPALYEDVTKTRLDLHSLGYSDLATFLDTLPDIFKRETLDGIKKDWLIYPADASKEEEKSTDTLPPKSSVLLTEFIIINTRKILQGYPEGIKLSEFLHVYSINCLEPLYIQDLGFASIEHFLLSIADRVPLKLESNEGCRTVHLVHKSSQNNSLIALYENDTSENIPADVAPSDTYIGTLKLPPNFDYNKYFPVYTSSIENPDLLYIQLKGASYSEALHELYDDIEEFYHGPESSIYRMKNADIKVGSVCIALWPVDRHWYRVKVLSIPSMDRVEVFYFDYGTKEQISTTMLRYIRQKYVDLPAQALTSRLAFLKPPQQATTWDPRTRVRMLKLCRNVSLMAKVEEIDADGVLSLILCDTNGEEDTYINDILLNEGLADCIPDEDVASPPSPAPQAAYTPLQIMQAQYFLQAWSNVSNAMNPDDLTKLVQTLTINQPNNLNPLSQLLPQPVPSLQSGPVPALPIPPPNPSPFQSPSPASSPFPQYHMKQDGRNQLLPPSQPSSTFYNNSFAKEQMSGRHETQVKQESTNRSAFLSSPIPQPTSSVFKDPYALEPIPGASSSAKLLGQVESEVFSDDDDELFLQLYQKVASVMKRYVKRIRTGDGYLFHILIIEGEPYVSSGDISLLIWSNQDPGYLLQRLQNRDVLLPSQTVLEENNEQLFYQIQRFHVKGCQKVNNVSCVFVYPLRSVIEILNMFGQPSIELRRIIISEISSFNQHQSTWQEISEAEFPDEEEEPAMSTDDDKLNRLSLFDLMAMKESIRIKRLGAVKNFETQGSNVEKVEKMESLYKKVVERIGQIKQICRMFSGNL